MAPVLILYGTTEGHTRSVAEALGRTLQLGGLEVDIVEAAKGDPDPLAYGAVIVAASIHAGGYQSAVVRWILRHARDLAARPNAFVSVCLAILQASDPKVMDELKSIVKSFSDKTGWQPDRIKFVAGALPYTRYNFVKRWIMKRIVAKAGGDTDTSKDFMYTDWDDLRRFADDFRRRLATAA